MNGGSAPYRLRAYFGETDMAHVAGLHQVRDGADGILYGYIAIEAGRAIDIDIVDSQALQRIGEKVAHRLGPCIVAEPCKGRA